MPHGTIKRRYIRKIIRFSPDSSSWHKKRRRARRVVGAEEKVPECTKTYMRKLFSDGNALIARYTSFLESVVQTGVEPQVGII